MPWIELNDIHGGKNRYFYPSFVKAREVAVDICGKGSQRHIKIFKTATGKTVQEEVQKVGGDYQVWIKGSKFGVYPIYKNGKLKR